MNSELKKSLNSLVALQNIYIQLVEEENPDHVETLSNYVSVIDSLKSQMKKSSIKFAKAMITNEDFIESLEIPNGIYITFWNGLNWSFWTVWIGLEMNMYLPDCTYVPNKESTLFFPQPRCTCLFWNFCK